MCAGNLLPRSLLPPGRRSPAGTSPPPASLLHLRPRQARDVLHAPRRGTCTSRRAPKPHVGMLKPLPVLSFLPFCRDVFNLFQVFVPPSSRVGSLHHLRCPLEPFSAVPTVEKRSRARTQRQGKGSKTLAMKHWRQNGSFCTQNIPSLPIPGLFSYKLNSYFTCQKWERFRSFTKTWKSF